MEGCQVIGRDWTYLYVNDTLAQHGRKKKEELIGRTMMEAYPGIEQTPVFEVLRRCMESGSSARILNEFTFEDGSKGWFQLSIMSIPQGLVIMSLDVTDRKKDQDEILRLNENLEQRVVERTEEIKAMNRELEAFAYSVSHDLRAPLRAVEGFSRILKSDHVAKLDDEGRRLLDIIVANVHKMDQLISDLLALSRVTRMSLHHVPVDMAGLVGICIQEVVGEAARKPRFEIGTLPDIVGDPVLLKQVWLNLIANAVKYSSGQKEPRIRIEGSADGKEASYSIKDNGVGFDPAYTHKLFGVFQRLHRDDEFPGTGVGLAIVQRIVHRHHGRVRIEGKLDHGATVHFSLPTGHDEVAPKQDR